MSRRPGHLVGAVTVHEPTTAKPYFRLVWVDIDGKRRQASGSTSPLTALEKAEAINRSLATTPTDPAEVTVGDLVAEYVSTPVGRRRTKGGRATDRDWSDSHYRSVRGDMQRAVVGVEHLPARLLDLATVDHMRSACGTPGMVNQMTRTVRCFLYWAEEQGAISHEQAELLPTGGRRTVRPRQPQPVRRPRRREDVREHGQDARYIREEDAPAQPGVCAFADALQRTFDWGALAVHTAAGAGLREGEEFVLRADDLRWDDRAQFWCLQVDWQWRAGSDETGRRARPKGGKVRRVPVAQLTAAGYPLLERLQERAAQARNEQEAGTNPQALLFPTPTGKIWQSGALNEHLVAAQKAAGWAYVMVAEDRKLRNGTTAPVKVTQMEQPWHTLRHRFARDMVATGMKLGDLTAIGGWDSIDVVSARYFGTGDEHVIAAAAILQPVAVRPVSRP